jgi:hypothetical protein
MPTSFNLNPEEKQILEAARQKLGLRSWKKTIIAACQKVAATKGALP